MPSKTFVVYGTYHLSPIEEPNAGRFCLPPRGCHQHRGLVHPNNVVAIQGCSIPLLQFNSNPQKRRNDLISDIETKSREEGTQLTVIRVSGTVDYIPTCIQCVGFTGQNPRLTMPSRGLLEMS